MNIDLYSTNFTIIGYVLFCFSSIIIGFFAMICFVSFISNKQIKKEHIKFYLSLFLMALSIWALLWDPAPYHDSYRHFEWLDEIRIQGLDIITFLKEGFKDSTYGNYKELIAFNVLRFIVVSVSQDNHILPFVSTMIVYLIFYYIVTDFFEREHINYKWLLIILLLSFSYMSYYMVVSGIRNALAASIAGLAIYRRIYRRKGSVEFVITSVIAMTVHPNIILALAISVVYPLFSGLKSLWILVVGILCFRGGYYLLLATNIPYLSYIGNVLKFYLVDYQYHGEMITYLVDIVVTICCLILLCVNRVTILRSYQYEKVRDVKHCLNTVDFIQVYLILLLVMSLAGSTNFLTRSGYVLGLLSIFIVKEISKCEFSLSGKGLLNSFLLMVVSFATMINIGSELLLLFSQFF